MKKLQFVLFLIIFILCCGCNHEKSSSIKISYCNIYAVSPLTAYSVLLSLDKLRKIGYSYTFENVNQSSFSFIGKYEGNSLFQSAAGDRFLADCFDKKDFYLGSLTLKKKGDSCAFLYNGKEIEEKFYFLIDNLPDRNILEQIKKLICNQ